MAKFFFFEYIVGLFYGHVFTAPKETYGKPTQLGVTFASGYLAGVVCAVVSHPADSLVSLMGKPEHKGKGLGAIASEVGFGTLATKGLGTRVIMIGTLTGTSDLRFRSSPHFITMTNISFPIPFRLPVVDLRLFQDRHGYGHHWWKVDRIGWLFMTLIRVHVLLCIHSLCLGRGYCYAQPIDLRTYPTACDMCENKVAFSLECSVRFNI